VNADTTILIVDDEMHIRFLLTEALSDAGLRAIDAADAAEAVAVMEGLVSVDLVLTDVNMPGSMNGLGLAKFIRMYRPKTKVVFLTSDAWNPSLRRWGDAYVSKPCDLANLVRTLADVLTAPFGANTDPPRTGWAHARR
jgi:CheY-like chemotaxis protein